MIIDSCSRLSFDTASIGLRSRYLCYLSIWTCIFEMGHSRFFGSTLNFSDWADGWIWTSVTGTQVDPANYINDPVRQIQTLLNIIALRFPQFARLLSIPWTTYKTQIRPQGHFKVIVTANSLAASRGKKLSWLLPDAGCPQLSNAWQARLTRPLGPQLHQCRWRCPTSTGWYRSQLCC